MSPWSRTTTRTTSRPRRWSFRSTCSRSISSSFRSPSPVCSCSPMRSTATSAVMALPISRPAMAPVAFVAMIGGLSAATAMVVVEVGRALDHGVEQSRPAAAAAGGALARRRRAACRRGRGRTADPAGAARRHPGRAASRLRLLPLHRARPCSPRSAFCPSPASRNSARPSSAPSTWRRGTSLGAIAGLITGRRPSGPSSLLAPSLDAGMMRNHRGGAISAASRSARARMFNCTCPR